MLRPLVLVAVVISFAGCNWRQNKLVGTWTATRRMAHSIVHFYPDGKLKTEVQSEAVSARTEGTYSYDGTNLTMSNTSVEVEGPEPMASQTKATLLEPGTLPINWNSPYSFYMPIPGEVEPLRFSYMGPNHP